MNLIMNISEDKNVLEKNIAYIKAYLIQKHIDDLQIENQYKFIIKEEIIKILNKA